MLQPGESAPNFSLPDADMQLRTLSEFAGRTLVLYFYPKDDTPGCTLQATDFTELIDQFEATGAVVAGVSGDDCFSHQSFRDKYGLKVTLLADVEREACQTYGVIQEKEKNGVKMSGIVRSTFVIDGGGTIRFAEYGVAPKGHASRVLDLVREIGR
jgi:peroxiredoxin Q/BCP